MICCMCKRETKLILVTNGKDYCEECSYEMFPPTMILMLTDEGNLFNPKLNRFEPQIDELEKCGFMLFMRKQFHAPITFTKHDGLTFKELLTFRYRGQHRCDKLIPDYSNWPISIRRCPKRESKCAQRRGNYGQ